MKNFLISLWIILFLAFGIFQLVVGYQGIEYHIGVVWALVALFFAFAFRFTLPITIGTYFGVVDVLGWHWIIGILLAVPGILFMAPAAMLLIFEPIFSKFSRKNADG